MNIPESINQLTTERLADSFIQPVVATKINVDDIIFYIKQKTEPENVRAFEEGIAYYKVANNERTLITGTVSLFTEKIIKAIRDSEIDEALKKILIENFDTTTKLLVQLLDQQYTFISSVLKQKKGIDVLKISYIMLGYAIETIRKVYNSKSQ